MKIWQVNYSYVSDTIVGGTCWLFDSYEKAKAHFDTYVKDTKENDPLMNSDSLVIEETENYFLIYEDGRLCEDNLEISIEEKNVL